SGQSLIQDLTVMLLDKGTKQRDRFALTNLIDNRGAQLRSRSNSTRIGFSGRAMRADLMEVITLLGEQLRQPLFDPAEVEKAKARLAGEIRRSMENTGAQAVSALTRQLFPTDHPNYHYPFEAELEALSDITLDDITSFYDDHFGARELTLVLVGDLASYPAADILDDVFSGWDPPVSASQFSTSGLDREPERIVVPVLDKQNLDVRIGHALALRRDDDAFLPVLLGNHALGGNFSARLMSVVRDQLGLTYGIGSQLAGASVDHDGYWRVAVTLSPDKLDEGIDATLGEIHRFVEQGLLKEELTTTKTTVTGSFKVDLGSTGGLAVTLLTNVLRGFGVEYLDEFPDRVNAVTLEEVNRAIQFYLQPERLHTVISGTI
ncbi:MAG: M16 family metallopeptidase, partial [Rhodothermales bacterium]